MKWGGDWPCPAARVIEKNGAADVVKWGLHCLHTPCVCVPVCVCDKTLSLTCDVSFLPTPDQWGGCCLTYLLELFSLLLNFRLSTAI